MKESDRPGTRISIRLSNELHAAVAALAARDRRSVAGWCLLLIEDAVAAAATLAAGPPVPPIAPPQPPKRRRR